MTFLEIWDDIDNNIYGVLEIFKQDRSKMDDPEEEMLVPGSAIRLLRDTDTQFVNGGIGDFLTDDESGFLAFITNTRCWLDPDAASADGMNLTNTLYVMHGCSRNCRT